jgi:hypothetical protein
MSGSEIYCLVRLVLIPKNAQYETESNNAKSAKMHMRLHPFGGSGLFDGMGSLRQTLHRRM